MSEQFSAKLRAIDMYETLFNNGVSAVPHFDSDSDTVPFNILSEDSSQNELEKFLGDDYMRYHKVIRDVMTYLVENKNKRPTLSEMADQFHVSPGYLSHLFTKELQESYSSFLSRIKMEWAKEYLESTEKSVNEIGEQLGFSDATYFIKVFKKHVGVTPLVYKNYYKNRNL